MAILFFSFAVAQNFVFLQQVLVLQHTSTYGRSPASTVQLVDDSNRKTTKSEVLYAVQYLPVLISGSGMVAISSHGVAKWDL